MNGLRHLQQGINLTMCTPFVSIDNPSGYNIQLINMGNEADTKPEFVDALDLAAKRWSKIIVGDLPDIPGGVVSDLFGGTFAPKFYNGPVDDLVIGYDVSTTIDGPGRVLGQAGGAFARVDQTGTPRTTISGIMRFDSIDLESMPINDVKAIILHEMGHVIGLVGLNGDCTASCNPNSFLNGIYECAGANEEYSLLSPDTLFLENSGGPGTACGHWEERSFRTPTSSELMTGFFEDNLFQPISLVTVAALDDIGGYEIDYCGADIWPATEDTIQRFEVFKTSQRMNVTEMMEPMDMEMMMMSPDGSIPGSNNIDLETCIPAVANATSLFNIALVNMGNIQDTKPEFEEALQKAAERWSKIIVGDLPDVAAGVVGDLFGGAFAPNSFNGAVDDVVIGYDVSSTIDGPSGTLGRAGGVFVRINEAGTPVSTISGIMQFDSVDLENMPIDDVKAIILHEMGHVLGLVGVNGDCAASCDPNSGINAPYECPAANIEYKRFEEGNSLFLENSGGPGTACGHWEEQSFRTATSSELMTGFFEANLFQPISLVTVAALDDIGGYQIDYCGADIWPATEETNNRYEIFKTTQEMNVDDIINPVAPTMMMAPDGSMSGPGIGGPGSAAFGASRTVGWALASLLTLWMMRHI